MAAQCRRCTPPKTGPCDWACTKTAAHPPSMPPSSLPRRDRVPTYTTAPA